MKSHQRQYLQEMDIAVWLDKKAPVATRQNISIEDNTESILKPDNIMPVFTAELNSLAQKVAICQQCSLHESRTQTVFGVGDPDADWFVIGEAPGADEDRQGEPFVGRAGQLLNAMLLAIGLRRKQVFIANILKCRPPHNRDPKPDEVIACESYLRQQLSLIKPKIILAVGRVAAQNLLKSDTPIGKMRGHCYPCPGSDLPVVVTYHPAYLLRSPREKRKVWADLKFAMQTYKAMT